EHSDATAREVDAEVGRLLAEAEARARALLRARREARERIAKRLCAVETLTGDALRAMLA
ncbi:MAG: hypothetical protein IT372_21920, partial [Polyangiaceae bacterium]|nr:hypothetical protein [Polyangiaceae bacterium]